MVGDHLLPLCWRGGGETATQSFQTKSSPVGRFKGSPVDYDADVVLCEELQSQITDCRKIGRMAVLHRDIVPYRSDTNCEA